MDSIPLGTLGIVLAVLLVTSGFFSLAETAMMAVNRYRLKHGRTAANAAPRRRSCCSGRRTGCWA